MTITAKIIADSISEEGIRLTTMQLRYPRFIHAEFMTHRVFSRNASSSRAVPVEKLIQDIIDDTAMPIHWGKNQPGMQAHEECDALIYNIDKPWSEETGRGDTRENMWRKARDRAIDMARLFDTAGYHKQIVNRLLEPFSHINVVVSSTQWSNFFALRDHPDAQPEIRVLAQEMKKAMAASTPRLVRLGEWHLPYITDDDLLNPNMKLYEDFIKCSVARCARVSYMTYEMKKPTLEEDLKLYDRLLGSQPIHASPAEHVATPDWNRIQFCGNFKGWCQYRKTLAGECQ